MKRTYLLLLAGLLSFSLYAQTNNFTIGYSIGGDSWDNGTAVVTDANNNIYITGRFQGSVDFNPSSSASDSIASMGGDDIFISKYRPDGSYQWTVTIGGSSYDGSQQIILNPSGNLLITGYFMGSNVDFDPGASTYLMSAGTSSKTFVLELDTMGAFVQAFSFEGNAYDLACDATGNIYLGGYFYNTVDLDPGTGTQSFTSNGNEDVFILKLSSTGTYIWGRAFGGTQAEEFAGLGVSPGGDVYYAGTFKGTVDLNPGSGVQNFTSNGGNMADVFVSKLDAGGNHKWAKAFGGVDGERATGCAIDLQENVYTTGDYIWTVDLDPGSGSSIIHASHGNNVFLQKLNKDGNFVWGKGYGGGGADISNDVHCDEDGNVYTFGEFSSQRFDVNPNMDSLVFPLTGIDGYAGDLFIQKLDSAGTFEWGTCFGGSWFEMGGMLTTDKTGAIIMISSTESDTLLLNSLLTDPLNNGGNDVVLVKYEPALATISASATAFTAPPFDVSFLNHTSDTTGIQWFWNFEDGSFSSDFEPQHTFAYNGTYDVTLLALNPASGQADTATIRITCSGGTDNPCNFTAEILQSGTPVICPTDSFKLTATPGNYSYHWYRNGLPLLGANDSILYAKEQGFYIALVSNSMCSQVSNFFMLGNHPTINPPILTSGWIMPCSNDSMTLSTPDNFTSYMWSTGESGTEISTKVSGRYTVTGIDQNGCHNVSLEEVVNASLADIPDICIVGFDDNTNHNVVSWEPITDQKIDSVKVYRESHIANQYVLIGKESVGGNTYVIDQNSNVSIRQYKYRIALVDTCGMESPTSPFHKNIHLMVNAALNDHWNLLWDPYAGVEVLSYKIYRGTDSTQMTLLTTLPGTVSSFTDLNNPPGDIFYKIEAVTNTSCGTFGTPTSNTFNTINASGVGVEELEGPTLRAKIYPNPNQGHFYMDVETTGSQRLTLQVFNALGALIQSEELEHPGSFTQKINLDRVQKGMYVVRLVSDSGVMYSGKMIVQ